MTEQTMIPEFLKATIAKIKKSDLSQTAETFLANIELGFKTNSRDPSFAMLVLLEDGGVPYYLYEQDQEDLDISLKEDKDKILYVFKFDDTLDDALSKLELPRIKNESDLIQKLREMSDKDEAPKPSTNVVPFPPKR